MCSQCFGTLHNRSSLSEAAIEAVGDWCVGGGASVVDRFMPRSEPLVPPIHVGRGLLLELRWGTNKGRRLTAEIFDGNRRVAKVWLHREDAGACMRSL